MAEAIELRVQIQKLVHERNSDAWCNRSCIMQNANCHPLALSLSLSLVVQMWARENTVAVSAFRAPPAF